MLRHRMLLLALAALALLSVRDLSAQRFTLDVRAAPAQPTENLAGTELGTGLTFGAAVAYQLQTHLHVYGGWDWARFGAERSFAGNDLDFEETGYDVGLRFEHPLRAGGSLLYRLEGGATYKHVEVENEAGNLTLDSGHGLGFEVAGGVVLPLGEGRWRLAPMIRYRSLSPEFAVGAGVTEGDLRYAALELGVSFRF